MADPANTSLAIRDGSSASQNLYTYSNGGVLMPGHVAWGWDGASTPHALLVDSSGRQLVSGAAAAGSAVAGNPVLVAGSDGTNARDLATDANGVLKAPYTRLLQLTSSFTPAASYTTNTCFGGLFTFDASATIGAAVQEVRLTSMFMELYAAAFVAANGMTSFWFNANPTGSTFTDNNAAALATADKTKLQYVVGFNALTAGLLGTGTELFTLANQTSGVPMMTDATGKLYMALVNGGAQTITTPAASNLTINLLY
jgi:hypothetical protein